MPKGGIIRVSGANVTIGENEIENLRPGRYLRCIFQDEGCGVSPDMLPKLFDPYLTAKPGQSGLGLSITYAVIRRHLGNIAIQSEVGKGTTVTLYLPAAEMPDQAKGRQTIEAQPFRRVRVLVMDDEEMLRTVLSRMLAWLGYEVSLGSDGEETVSAYKKAREEGKPFDVVIMDLTIPRGMGGREAVGLLREMDPSARVIACSGYSNDPILANFREYGFSYALSKPFKTEDLQSALETALGS